MKNAFRPETVLFAVLAGGLLPGSGCVSLVARHAFYELRGATGTIRWIEEIKPVQLEPFRSLSFAPATTTIGPKLCPPELLAEYDRQARELARTAPGFEGGEPTLNISTEILYFQAKGILHGALLLARVTFSGPQGPLGSAIIYVESKSFREGDTGDLAETAVKTIGKFLKQAKQPPEEEDDDQQESKPLFKRRRKE